MSDFIYYAIALLVLVIGLVIVKKVATCMVKMVVGFIMLVVLAGLYWLYFT